MTMDGTGGGGGGGGRMVNGYSGGRVPQPGSPARPSAVVSNGQSGQQQAFMMQAFLQAQAQAQALSATATDTASPSTTPAGGASSLLPGQIPSKLAAVPSMAPVQQNPNPGQTPFPIGRPSDPTAGNAVAGPSNPAANHAHYNRPSLDQITLMQRLHEAAKKGGLPIQTIYTKTSWVPSSENDEPLPEFTQLDVRNLEEWMKKDVTSVERMQQERNRMKDSLEEMAQDMLVMQDWLGPPRLVNNNHHPPIQPFKLRTRRDMEKELSKGKRKNRPWMEL